MDPIHGSFEAVDQNKLDPFYKMIVYLFIYLSSCGKHVIVLLWMKCWLN